MFMMIFYISRVTDLTYAKSAPACMNMAVDLSWWRSNNCSSLFVHQAMNSLFQHAWTSMSTTMFKLTNSTMFKPAVNRQKQAMGFYVCRWRPFRNYASVANESTPLVESLVDWSKGDRSAVGCWKVQIYFFKWTFIWSGWGERGGEGWEGWNGN